MTDLHEGDDLAVELRYFTIPQQAEPISGRELLEVSDHDRDLLLLLRILRRGETGRMRQQTDLTRIW